MKQNFQLKEGGSFEMPLPSRVGNKRQFVFALPKSGSVLLNAMVSDMVSAADLSEVNLPGFMFTEGFSWKQIESGGPEFFSRDGYVYTGFRAFPPPQAGFNLDQPAEAILLVRDPRDILVSLYFSILKSHGIPQGGAVRDTLLKQRENAESLDIDEFVLERAKFTRRQFEIYHNKLIQNSSTKVKLFRYEDVIFKKRKWVEEIADFFRWDLAPEVLHPIADQHDQVPTDEDSSRHIRKVTPGDHKEKLTAETIKQLDDIFREVCQRFGYCF